ncbi:hypothetical protein L2D01_00265 [Hyphomonadaceae bacterium ML37]|nr:hypothetical protein L2D01_00265 [Hyphomonadaceae bacterium ML37]
MTDDRLHYADMRAVLSRTRLSRDLDGLLMPLFEAASNSFHSTAERWKEDNPAKGTIIVEINTDPDSAQPIFTLDDNGMGLNDENYKSFLTPFSGHKLDINGKGFGRFINFKVFDDCFYSSLYDGRLSTPGARHFIFDVFNNPEVRDAANRARLKRDIGTKLELSQIKEEYREILSASDQMDVVERFIKHFLSYFISPNSPKIMLNIDGVQFDIAKHFSEFFTSDHQFNFDMTLQGQSYSFSGALSRVERSKLFNKHAILFQASDRVIGSGRDISNKIGREFFRRDDDSKYVIVASASGEYFDDNSNNERTIMTAPSSDVDAIVNRIVDEIRDLETERFEEIKERQGTELREALMKSPLLRLGMRGQSIKQYVRSKPNSWTDDEFVQDLAVLRYRDTKNWHEDLEKSLTDVAAFESKKTEILKRADSNSKEALAEYVVHRRAILDIADTLRKMTTDGSRPTEDEFHDLIFARNSDSTTTNMKDHNL